MGVFLAVDRELAARYRGKIVLVGQQKHGRITRSRQPDVHSGHLNSPPAARDFAS